jgi:DnaJ-class molecular chaperone
MSEDYYQILGVAKNASDADIQKAYRRLARKHHPDLAEDKQKAKEQFQRVQQAYDVLSDPEKRRRYDQLGPNFESYATGGRGPFGSGPHPGGMEIDLGDLFGQGGAGGASIEELLRQFGMPGRTRSRGRSGGGTRTAEPPAEAVEQITIPFNTAVLGGQHQLQLARDGAAPESITLKIPAGIESGQTLRLRGQGASDRRGNRGDLLVAVQVAPHPHFERRGVNLHVVVPVSIREAVLGAKIDLPTPHGTISVSVPPNSSSGRLLRLKGMGIRPAGRPHGDLIAEIRIVLPAEMTEHQKKQLRDWAEGLGDQPRRELSW